MLPEPKPGEMSLSCKMCKRKLAAARVLDKQVVNRVLMEKAEIEQLKLAHLAPSLAKDVDKNAAPSLATISVDCPECGAHKVGFYTKQLRGADEGQTIFYECPECNHKWNENS